MLAASAEGALFLSPSTYLHIQRSETNTNNDTGQVTACLKCKYKYGKVVMSCKLQSLPDLLVLQAEPQLTSETLDFSVPEVFDAEVCLCKHTFEQ